MRRLVQALVPAPTLGVGMVTLDGSASLAADHAICVEGVSFQADGESLVADGMVVHFLSDCRDALRQGDVRHGVAEPRATRC